MFAMNLLFGFNVDSESTFHREGEIHMKIRRDFGTIDKDSLDTCEGARWSVDLRKYSIKEAWENDTFERFRNHFRKACPSCEKREQCMGGCPIRPEIVLCEKKRD